MPRDIVWTAHEHTQNEKTTDWFWALGIVAISSAIVAILFKNVLFGVLILVAASTMALLASRESRERTFALTPRGIMVDEQLFPYKMLVSFWIQDRETDHPVLIIDAQRVMVPHIISTLENADAEQIQTYLEEYLPEIETIEPIGQRILEKFGF